MLTTFKDEELLHVLSFIVSLAEEYYSVDREIDFSCDIYTHKPYNLEKLEVELNAYFQDYNVKCCNISTRTCNKIHVAMESRKE